MSGPTLKVLLSAYACLPELGSEPGVGWNVAMGMARHHDVWVITRASSRATIERELARSTSPTPRFVYLDLPRAWSRGRLGQTYAYEAWQVLGRRAARTLHAQVGFDLAHHVTYAKYTAPSMLAGLPIPFIWGPVGGGESMPRAFERQLDLRGRAHEAARRFMRRVRELDPAVRRTARRSAVALATTPETAERLKRIGARDVRMLLQVGCPREEILDARSLRRETLRTFRIVSAGRLLHWKGFDLGLRAFAAARLPDAEYWIFGDGPERGPLERLARELGAGDRVRFLGDVPRARVVEELRRSHLLVHPSLHEGGGLVCCEAMAAGCPVACLDLGGPALQVDSASGFVIAARSPERVVAELTEVIQKLAFDPELFHAKSNASRQSILDRFTWERKCEQLADLYRSVASEGSLRLDDTRPR